MQKPSDPEQERNLLLEKIIGLGERSARKSYYPELQQRLRELEKAEREVAAAHARLEAVLAAATEVSIVATDSEGIVTLFNRGAEKMLGYTADEVVGKLTLLTLHLEGELRERARELSDESGAAISGFAAFVEIARKIGAERREWTFVRKDGSQLTVSLSVTLMHDAAGKVVGYLGIAEDITDRKWVEQQLLESREFLDTVMNSVPAPIFFKDRAGVILMCNEEFALFRGLPKERIIGKTVYDILPAKLAAIHDRIDREIIETGGNRVYEASISHADGTMHDVLLHKSLVQEPDGSVRGIVGVMLDITERKQSEAEKERLLGELLQAQKMESVGRLAGGVAHDFNNLLAPIIGYAEMVLMQMQADHPHHARLKGILDAAFKARDLTGQLLGFSRKQMLEMRRVDLNRIIHSFSHILRRTIRENIDIDIRLAPDLRSVQGDQMQLEQVLMNLAINAQDAIEGGNGRIAIETANVTVDEEHGHGHPLMPSGEYVVLAVSDTGCGIDAAIMEQVFEPFFTTKGAGKGTGLGLAMVYGIVKQHSGNLQVESEPGKGTVFRLFFPSVPGVPALEEEKQQDLESLRAGATILLVEDNKTVRDMTADVLRTFGCEVLVADDVHHALLLYRTHRVDLLVSDVVMPVMNGPELLRELRKTDPDLKVLFMSGYTNEAIFRNGNIDEFSFLQKPFTLQALLTKLNELLGQPAQRHSF